jgi:hypothetical protein
VGEGVGTGVGRMAAGRHPPTATRHASVQTTIDAR